MKIIERETISNAKFGKTMKKAYCEYNGKFYVVSDNGEETLIFESDKDWNHNWIEVGGSRGVTIDQVLSDFSNYLSPFYN